MIGALLTSVLKESACTSQWSATQYHVHMSNVIQETAFVDIGQSSVTTTIQGPRIHATWKQDSANIHSHHAHSSILATSMSLISSQGNARQDQRTATTGCSSVFILRQLFFRNPCTADRCLEGECLHIQKQCQTTDNCHTSHCDTNTGQCTISPIVCDDGKRTPPHFYDKTLSYKKKEIGVPTITAICLVGDACTHR
jgi:hypothetical protein